MLIIRNGNSTIGEDGTSKTRVPIFEKFPRAFAGAILIGISLLTDVAFGSVRSWLFDPLETGRKIERRYRIESEIYHHDLAPNLRNHEAMWGPIRYSISTNSLGFKDLAPREVALVSDQRRVVFMGDSFTEGVGLPYEDTFVGLVDGALSQRGTEVLNAAVASYSPSIYYRKVRHLIETTGLQFDELIVLVDIADIHDDSVMYEVDVHDRVRSTTSGSELAPTRERGLKAFIRDNTIVTSFILQWVRSQFVDVSRVGRTGWERGMWTVDESIFERFGPLGLANMAKSMNALAALTDSHGISMTVAVYPWPDQIANADLESRHVQFWRQWSEEKGVRFLDLFPEFVSGEIESTLDTYFIPRDVHWSAQGHRHVADLIMKKYFGLPNGIGGQ